jgi:hypothetical protein
MNTKNLYGGTLGSTSATLYTATNKVLVKEVILCNKTGTAATATIAFNGINIINAKSIAANDYLKLDLCSAIEATKVITGLAGTASAIDCYISGIEITE